MSRDVAIWVVIFGVGIGTYLIRFSFIAVAGGREFPAWAMRLLRYVPVAVMPAIAAPLVVWPAATDGQLDPARMIAAVVALAIGAWWRAPLAAILGGMATLYAGLWLLG